ncbi:MAG: hypothetical protein IKC64_00385 [Clostridia bacterium]|nr:hypothetical protein [Clostridia bacterium]
MKQLSLKRTICLALTTVFGLLSIFMGAFGFNGYTARAEELNPSHEWEEQVEFANGDFTSTSSGSILTPEKWSSSNINGMPNPTSGVVDVRNFPTLSVTEKNNYGFDSSVLPLNTFSGATDDKILFINAKNVDTAFGYTSEEYVWPVCSYYRVSVYVKTVGVSNGRGASVKLNGLGDKEGVFYGINNIDTNGEWIKYTIFAKTTAVTSSNVSITLALGCDGDHAESTGVAFFDSVTVTSLSSYKFYQSASTVNSDTVKTIMVDDEETLFPGGQFNGTVDDFGTVNSGIAQIVNATNGANLYDVSGVRPAIEDEAVNNILAISTSYDASTSTFYDGYASVTSKNFTVKRFERLRISGWFYAPTAHATDGTNIVINYKSSLAGASDDFVASERKTLTASTNNAHNGWTQFVIYLSGSERCDFTANLELSLGSKDNDDATGIAFFDDISFKRISPSNYTNNSNDATLSVVFDADANTENFTNGWMTTVSNYDDLDAVLSGAPAIPYGWTYNNTDTVTSQGYSKVKVNTDDAVSGIVAIDGKTDILATKYPEFAGINFGNALLLSSTSNTAFCYESATHTLDADKYAELTVSLATEDLTGYGANIVLKKDTTVVATIEKITENGNYTFYIKNGSKSSSFTVELWLGLNDRNNNATKLASGSVYFTRVALKTDSTAEIFNTEYASYNANRINEFGIKKVAVSLADEDFMAFDSYDTASVKTPYNWSLTKGEGSVAYGVFDTQDQVVYDVVPSYYDNGGERFALVLRNLTKTYSTLTLNNNFNLTTGSYYKLTFSVKVDIPDEYLNSDTAKGAFISIGTGYKFEFKQTLDEFGNATFKTYTFLIKAPDADSTTTITIGLGDSKKANNYTEGALYINKMTFESLDSSEYADLTAGLKDGDNSIDEYTMRAPLSTTPVEDDDDDHMHTTAPVGTGAETWWLIHTILIAVAILIAVLGAIIRKFIERHPKNPGNAPKIASYDRRNLNKGDDKNDTDDTTDSFDKFDEDEDDDTITVDATEVPAEDTDAPVDEATENTDAPTEETAEITETPADEVSETTENIGGEPTENAVSLDTDDDEE